VDGEARPVACRESGEGIAHGTEVSCLLSQCSI
jgi:hypothetical protein